MKRLIVLITSAASLMMLSVPASAAVRFGVGFGYGYGRPVYVPGPVWVGPAHWGPPIYSAVPERPRNSGELKIDTKAKDSSVYINGAYAGTVGKLKTVWLRSGDYDIEVRTANGRIFDQRVFVPVDKKIVVEPVFTAAGD